VADRAIVAEQRAAGFAHRAIRRGSAWISAKLLLRSGRSRRAIGARLLDRAVTAARSSAPSSPLVKVEPERKGRHQEPVADANSAVTIRKNRPAAGPACSAP
jgi:hypothetical protein